MNWAVVLLVVSALALIIAAYFYAWVKKLPSAGGKLDSVGQLISLFARSRSCAGNTGFWVSLRVW